MTEAMPCRSCAEWKETSFRLYECSGECNGKCQKGEHTPMSFSIYGENTQEQGEKLCPKYNHVGFPW